jgi:hypothetical protein
MRNKIQNHILFCNRALFAALMSLGVAVASPPAKPACGPDDSSATEAPHAQMSVKVTSEREGNVTHFYVQNNELCEVTMTFEMKLENLKGNTSFPFTGTFPPGQKTEAFALSPVSVDSKWGYSYTNYYKLGSNCVKPDDDFVYQLPYAPGAKFKVTQGYNGKFSHTGSNKYATDWQMPEGTLVCAARGGVVVRTRDDSEKGGSSMAFDRYNNYVLIRHDDGTLGHYCHLQKAGCLVKPGQRVSAGQPIAHSGNTGFSSGPHLHFCVFKTKNGRERVSIPVKFSTEKEGATTLLGGHTYRAPERQTASATAAKANPPAAS